MADIIIPEEPKQVNVQQVRTELSKILDAIKALPEERGSMTKDQWRRVKAKLKYQRARLSALVNPNPKLPILTINGPSVEVRGWFKDDERRTRRTTKDRKTKNIQRRR